MNHQSGKLLSILMSVFLGCLILLTLVTGGCLVFTIGSYIAWRRTEPPTFPGDPDIGAGLIYLAAMLNLPTLAGWCAYFVCRGLRGQR